MSIDYESVLTVIEAAPESLRALARETGLSRSTLWRLKHGESVSLATLEKIGEALGLSHVRVVLEAPPHKKGPAGK